MHCNVISEQTSLAKVFISVMLMSLPHGRNTDSSSWCSSQLGCVITGSTTHKQKLTQKVPLQKMTGVSLHPHSATTSPVQEVLAFHMPSTYNSHSIPPPKQMSPQGNFLRDFQVLPDLWSPLLNQGGVLCPSFEQTHPLRPNSHYLLDNWNGRGEEKGKRAILTNIFHFHCPLMETRGKG